MISATSLRKPTGTNIAEWNNKNPNEVATPTRFELAISALTGPYVKPLHHGAVNKTFICYRERF